MIKSALRAGMYCIVAVALTGAPMAIQAQAEQPNAEKNEAKDSRKSSGITPFNAKLKSVDTSARTIHFGETTLLIAPETKIIKAGKPATLEDAVVGEQVAGAYKRGADGKLTATTVRFGPKPDLAMDSDGKKE
jgi:hypothetical protein